MPKRIEMVGKRFGRIVVTSDRNNDGSLMGESHYRTVIVECDCGTVKEVSARSLMKGHTRSCGCLHKDTITKHGLDSTPLSAVWRSMLFRCESSKCSSYKHYGKRGIKVCKEWRDDMVLFIKWAEENGWKRGLQIDRVDNDGNYCPGNCRFVSAMENANNKRSNRTIDVNGETLSIAQASRKYGLPYDRLFQRLYRLGWSPQKAISQ